MNSKVLKKLGASRAPGLVCINSLPVLKQLNLSVQIYWHDDHVQAHMHRIMYK